MSRHGPRNQSIKVDFVWQLEEQLELEERDFQIGTRTLRGEYTVQKRVVAAWGAGVGEWGGGLESPHFSGEQNNRLSAVE